VTRWSWTAFVGLLIFTMGTSIITPLLPLYQDRFDLSNGDLTLLFAVYAATVVPTMLVMGNLSDRVGRRRVMLPAMVTLMAASLLFAFAESVPMLYVGRVLQGLAVGGFLGVGTAFVVDHALPERRAFAANVAGFGFRVGFGLGPGMAGLVAEYSSNPIHRPFEIHAALMVVAILAILVTPETVPRRPPRIEIRVGVPPGQMAGFATFLAPAAFMMSLLDGTLLSVVPLYMTETLGERNLAIVGLVGFLVLGLGGAAPFIARRFEPRRAVMVGVTASSLASLLVVAAAGANTVALVITAAAVIGLTNGLILQGGTAICGVVSPLQERGKLISALYVCAYAGTLPTIGLGYLSGAIGLTATLAVFSGMALAFAGFVLLVGARLFPRVVPYVEPAAPALERVPA
jgi:MFS family permease